MARKSRFDSFDQVMREPGSLLNYLVGGYIVQAHDEPFFLRPTSRIERLLAVSYREPTEPYYDYNFDRYDHYSVKKLGEKKMIIIETEKNNDPTLIVPGLEVEIERVYNDGGYPGKTFFIKLIRQQYRRYTGIGSEEKIFYVPYYRYVVEISSLSYGCIEKVMLREVMKIHEGSFDYPIPVDKLDCECSKQIIVDEFNIESKQIDVQGQLLFNVRIQN